MIAVEVWGVRNTLFFFHYSFDALLFRLTLHKHARAHMHTHTHTHTNTQENYARRDPVCVQKVKVLYKELDLEQVRIEFAFNTLTTYYAYIGDCGMMNILYVHIMQMANFLATYI